MKLLNIPNVEYRGFSRKLAFYVISCEHHFAEGYCDCDDVDDCSTIELDPNMCDWRQRLRSTTCRKFTPVITFEAFKKKFCQRDFRDFSSISIRFMFSCECLSNCFYLMELSELLLERKEIYYITKIVGITRNQNRYNSFKYNGPYFELETQAINELFKINNLFFVAHEFPAWKSDFYDVHIWWYKLRNRMTRLSLQEAISTITISTLYNVECKSTADDLYAEAINPALVIIDNHLTFPDEKLYRIGSLKDAEDLSVMFSRKNIPQIIIRDSQIEHDDAIFNFLRNGNLNSLKDLYVFIMSHGIEDDIILSGDKQYAIYERIKQVMDNPYLKDVKKYFFIIACRGKIDPMWEETNNEIHESKSDKTDASILDENTIVVHSAPKHHVSPRTTKGSVFLQHMREIYGKQFYKLSDGEFAAKMDERLKQCDYYGEYGGKRFEIVKNDKTSMNMSTTFVNKYNCTCLENIAEATVTEKYVTKGSAPYPPWIQEKLRLERLRQEQEAIEALEYLRQCGLNA